MPAAWIQGGAALLGAFGAYKSSKNTPTQQTTTNTQTMDPRIAAMLFGNGTQRLKPGVTPTWATGQPDANGQTWDTASNPQSDYTTDSGLLSHYQGLLGQPQSNGIAAYGRAQDGYLAGTASEDVNHLRAGSYNQIDNKLTAPTMQAAQVRAPTQNSMNLTGSYDSLINGPAGANPFLTGAIGKGINQSNNAFGAMQRDSTKNLMENIMPSIRSNSVLAGQYGGSRQGIAEGRALDTFATEQQRAMSQVGQNNTDAAVAAQAGAYDADKNRQLAATQGLGAQQYGVASQDANLRQAGDQTNISALMATHGLNANAQQAGMGNLSGLLGTAYTAAQNQDGYALNQAGKVNGLLAPYLGQVPRSSTESSPLYENKGGSMIGGAMGGLALGKQFGGLLSGWGGGTSNPGAGANGYVDWGSGTNPGAIGPNGYVNWGS